MTMKQVEDKYELSHPTMTKILKDVSKYTKAKLNNPNMIEDIKKIGDWMYKNASLYLRRKKEKYNNFLSHYWQN